MGQRGGGARSAISYASDKKQLLIDSIERNNGTIICIAHELGIHRDWLYRLIGRFRLWPVVNEARRRGLILKAVEKRTNYSGQND